LQRFLPLSLVLVVLACDASPEPEPAAEPAPTPPAAAAAAGKADQLVSAAERIVAFLEQEAALDTLLLADTVTLYIAPEGGGQQRALARAELVARDAWRVGERTLVPGFEGGDLITRAGVHINCREYQLATRVPELARYPHVGTRLNMADGESCLEGWNTTFVFDSASASPRLVAAVYDQWEW
jgi:hypothetical protein